MKPTSLKTISEIIGSSIHTSDYTSEMILTVAVDSRLVIPGTLFFALPGNQTDGHAFLEIAFSNGALAAVVSSEYKGKDYGLHLIRCENVLDVLQLLAKRLLEQSRLRVIAVTGSVGKTTTKDMIATLLRYKYKVSVSPGNSNSQIGLPLAIINHTDFDGDFLVLEMGMTHPGQIKKLVEIAPPEVAVITSVALVHACNFNSLEEIALAKAEIFTQNATKAAIYHHESDLDNSFAIAEKIKKYSFSVKDSSANFYLESEKEGLVLKELDHLTYLPHLKIPGAHNIQNFLAAIAVARYCGMSGHDIALASETLRLPERRLERVEKFGAIFINDSYNASEISVKAALNSMPLPERGGKRIMVLGEMAELGKFSEQCHRSVAEAALEVVDMIFCFGEAAYPVYECWNKLGRKVVWSKERNGIIADLKKQLKPGDVVLLKGSRSKETWNVLDELEMTL